MRRGGAVEHGGTSVTFAPRSLLSADGSEFEGESLIQLAVIDATDMSQLRSMPGDWTATNARGAAVQLQSFGAAWVRATDESGRELRVNPACAQGVELSIGSTAEVDVDGLAELPSLWSFEQQAGKWRQNNTPLTVDGQPIIASDIQQLNNAPPIKSKGRKKGKKGMRGTRLEAVQGWTAADLKEALKRASRKNFKAPVTSLGWWNCDSPLTIVLISGKVFYDEAEGALGASSTLLTAAKQCSVYAVGGSYHGTCSTATGEDGTFTVAAQFDATISVEVWRAGSTGWAAPGDADEPSALCYKFGPFNTPATPGETLALGELRLDATSLGGATEQARL